MSKMEEWERNAINALTLKLLFAATLGTLAAVAIAFIVKQASGTIIPSELLFAPWGIALVIGISMAFHQGVMAERHRSDTAKGASGPAASEEE